MPTIHITAYLKDEEYSKYIKSKEQVNEETRKAFFRILNGDGGGEK